ncbi:MAG: polysaccharide pyruvyl transferase CsaB [Candidatus Melainabacteria bacterium]|jgi:polysaccharide pyruvyl transferase CsaB|nr:polysaccharide pyruvyl transferase CsaB [Candidatus Melainabacteria bacterium]
MSVTSTPQKRILLSGYYGFANYGDELICQSLCQQLTQQGLKVTVLSNAPVTTRATLKVGAINRSNPFQVVAGILNSQIFLSGGGGLFQDTTSPKSVIYYGGLMILARLLGKKVVHAFQSVGPIERPFSKWFTKIALKSAQFVMVRDEKSAELVTTLTGNRPFVTADAVWALTPDETLPVRPPNPLNQADAPLFRLGISLRPHPTVSMEKIQLFAQLLASFIASVGKPVELVLLPCQETMDTEILSQLDAWVKEAVLNQPKGQVKSVMAPVSHLSKAIAGCHALIGMRYHSVVSGLLHEVPVFALDYDPKVTALCQAIGLPNQPVTEIDAITIEQLFDAFVKEDFSELTALKTQVQIGFNALFAML